MKRQADRERKKAKEWKVRNRVMLSMKDLVFKERLCQAQFTLGVKVCEMGSEMCGLVKQPWFQLMCCAICLPCGCNFR